MVLNMPTEHQDQRQDNGDAPAQADWWIGAVSVMRDPSTCMGPGPVAALAFPVIRVR